MKSENPAERQMVYKGCPVSKKQRRLNIIHSLLSTTAASMARIREEIERQGYGKPSAKTIQRDLVELGAQGVEVIYNAANNTYKISSGSRKIRDLFRIEPEQAASLHIARMALGIYHGTKWHAHLEDILRNIEAGLTPEQRDRFESARDRLAFSPSPSRNAAIDAQMHHFLEDACDKGLEVELSYTGDSMTPKPMRVWPVGMTMYDGMVYLIAKRVDRNMKEVSDGIVPLPLTRMKDPTPTGVSFDRSQFDHQKIFKHSIGISLSKDVSPVKIRFTGRVCRYIAERDWHSSAKITWEGKDSLILSMTVAKTFELEQLVLRFANFAEVLEPADFRAEIASRLEKAVANYRTPVKLKKTA